MYWKIPPPPLVEGGKISADGIWGKNEKGRGKGGKVREKGRKGERKGKGRKTKRKWEVAAPG
jgi:hypothetical protein